MNDVIEYQSQQLPDTLEDLTAFVLVGKSRLNAYMLKLKTVNKLSVAQEIRDQTLAEAQALSNALIAAEQRIGELLLAIPKATAYNNPSGKEGSQIRDRSKLGKSKSETVEEMGYSKDDVSGYQQMAKNPEIVKKVIADALENGEVVTKSQVLKEIKAAREEAKKEAEAKKTTREKFAEQKADRLQEENDILKDEISSRDQKIDELLSEISNIPPATVYPEDYVLAKEQAKSAEAARKRTASELQKANQRIRDLEERKGIDEIQKKLEEEAGYFAVRTYDYIQKNGGFVWITERLEQLPDNRRKEFIKTVYAIDAFAKQMVENIGGYGIE